MQSLPNALRLIVEELNSALACVKFEVTDAGSFNFTTHTYFHVMVLGHEDLFAFVCFRCLVVIKYSRTWSIPASPPSQL
jgi:hypothetical protein